MKAEKRFIQYKEGAELYSMSQSKSERMAKDAEAAYKLDKRVLVNGDIFEEYLLFAARLFVDTPKQYVNRRCLSWLFESF